MKSTAKKNKSKIIGRDKRLVVIKGEQDWGKAIWVMEVKYVMKDAN